MAKGVSNIEIMKKLNDIDTRLKEQKSSQTISSIAMIGLSIIIFGLGIVIVGFIGC